MNKYSDEYFIKIKPELLFDTNKIFKSNYTPWVYVNLRFKYNVMLQKAPNNMYPIDVEGLSNILEVPDKTIYACLEDLRNANLIEKKGTSWKLLPDSNYVTESKNSNFPKSFVMVYRNYYFKLLNTVREYVPIDKKTRGYLPKVMSVYYYLITCNKHCLLTTPVVESNKTQTSLSRELPYDYPIIKNILSLLQYTGYIKYNEENKILTIDKNLYVENLNNTEDTDNIEPDYYNNYQESQYAPAKAEPFKVDEPQVPRGFIGFSKSDDGSKIMCIYYGSNIKERTLFVYCDGDGTPFTGDDYERYTDLIQNGKSSIYYDPNSYWKYQSERKAFLKKNPKKAS